jgi:hypothetical protein
VPAKLAEEVHYELDFTFMFRPDRERTLASFRTLHPLPAPTVGQRLFLHSQPVVVENVTSEYEVLDDGTPRVVTTALVRTEQVTADTGEVQRPCPPAS